MFSTQLDKTILKLGATTPITNGVNIAIGSDLWSVNFSDKTVKLNGADQSLCALIDLLSQHDPILKNLWNSRLYKSLSDETDVRYYNPFTQSFPPFTEERVKEYLGPWVFSYYRTRQESLTWFEYNPYQSHLYTNTHGEPIFNIYSPPEWRRKSFFSGTAILKATAIPSLYHKFFKHLVGNDRASYDYLLDWIAGGLHGVMNQYLILLGDQGIGKGTLGEILSKLHGDTNYTYGGDKMLKSTFNGELKNKTLIYLNEINIDQERERDAYNRFKALVDPSQEVEAKHQDRERVPRWYNVYVSANDRNSIPLEGKDRRYSIIRPSKIALQDSGIYQGTVEAYVKELTSDANIAALAAYLYYRQPVSNMERPFIDQEQMEDVLDASLGDWEDWLINQWCSKRPPGSEHTIARVKQEVKEATGVAPGRDALQRLSKKTNGRYFRIINIDMNTKGIRMADGPANLTSAGPTPEQRRLKEINSKITSFKQGELQ